MTDPADDTSREDGAVASDATESRVLTFRDGLPGFPQLTRFVIVEEIEDGAFQLLQSIEDRDVALVVTVPWQFFPDYAPEISEIEASELGLETAEDAIVVCPVTLDAEQDQVFLNLLGPIVINMRNHEGRQLVLTDSDHPVRAAVDLSGV